jgi:hypothetical protein
MVDAWILIRQKHEQRVDDFATPSDRSRHQQPSFDGGQTGDVPVRQIACVLGQEPDFEVCQTELGREGVSGRHD